MSPPGIPRLILASTSPYRRLLLEKLGLDFDCVSPGIDETRQLDEPPEALVTRLATEKSGAIAIQYPNQWVIGCDQVAVLENQVIGKPGSLEKAQAQLVQASGRTLEFLTGICVTRFESGHSCTEVDRCRVSFRSLTLQQIERYLAREQPLDCAGSFKSEGLGISLLERIEGDDPNALIGLPLIRLVSILTAFGIEIP